MHATQLITVLATHYRPHGTALHYHNPWELLVAIMLSAQCTDVRVNLTTPKLFKKIPTMLDMKKTPTDKIESLIFSTGFYKNKAKNIKAAATTIIHNYAGNIPNTMQELTKIPGIGRKSANVYLHLVHQKVEGVVVDTHIFRVSRRTGVSKGTTPEQVEREIMRTLPKQQWILYGDLVIQHGRKICHARKPTCNSCFLNRSCPSAFKV